jgi:hypothetical protein
MQKVINCKENRKNTKYHPKGYRWIGNPSKRMDGNVRPGQV